MKEPYILAIETATEVCSVAISKSGVCIAEKHVNEQNVHGSVLTVLIDEILKSNGLNISHLSAVSYSSGPGSYTGLRIGLSVAKGICFGSGIPLISITTLEQMASAFPGDYCFPMIDARRMEVYGALLNNGNFVIPPFACLVDQYNWNDLLKEREIIFIGNGVDKSKAILQKFPNAKFIENYLISANTLSELAYKKYLDQDFADLAYDVPFYLKEANVTEAKKGAL